jgi:calcium-dependent protein kinase
MAPQVLQGIYSSKADLWSVGVIAYMLLSASKPFYSKRRRKLIDLIMRCDYTFETPIWKEAISADAKDFIDKLLVVDPKSRWDAAKALKHPWLVNREQLPDEKPSEALLDQVEDSLLNYRQTSALKKLALNVIAHRSSTTGMICYDTTSAPYVHCYLIGYFSAADSPRISSHAQRCLFSQP